MPPIQVVKLAPEEWRLYRQIRLEALEAEPQAFASSYAEVLQRPVSHWHERLVEAQAGVKSWLLFAKEDDRIAGMIGAYRSEAGDGVDIIAVYVSREKRGRGIGAALMAAILEEVSQGGGFHKAELTVNADQAAAIALYRRFGFQIVGEQTGVMGDGQIHSGYVMEKIIGETGFLGPQLG